MLCSCLLYRLTRPSATPHTIHVAIHSDRCSNHSREHKTSSPRYYHTYLPWAAPIFDLTLVPIRAASHLPAVGQAASHGRCHTQARPAQGRAKAGGPGGPGSPGRAERTAQNCSGRPQAWWTRPAAVAAAEPAVSGAVRAGVKCLASAPTCRECRLIYSSCLSHVLSSVMFAILIVVIGASGVPVQVGQYT